MKLLMISNPDVERSFYCTDLLESYDELPYTAIYAGNLPRIYNKYDMALVHHSIIDFDVACLGTRCKLFGTNTSNLGDKWSDKVIERGCKVFRTNNITRDDMKCLHNVADYAISMALMAWFKIPQRVNLLFRDSVRLPPKQINSCTYYIFGNRDGRIYRQIDEKMSALGAKKVTLCSGVKPDFVFNCSTPNSEHKYNTWLLDYRTEVYGSELVVVDVCGRVSDCLETFVKNSDYGHITLCIDTVFNQNTDYMNIISTPRCAGSTKQARAFTEKAIIGLMRNAFISMGENI